MTDGLRGATALGIGLSPGRASLLGSGRRNGAHPHTARLPPSHSGRGGPRAAPRSPHAHSPAARPALGVSAAGSELSHRSLEALGSPFSPPLSVTPPRLLPATTRQLQRASLSYTELFLPRGLPGASAGGREGGRQAPSGHGTGAPPSCSSRSRIFTRIFPCGRSGGTDTSPARPPASLGRAKQPFCRQRAPRSSPPAPEQNNSQTQHPSRSPRPRQAAPQRTGTGSPCCSHRAPPFPLCDTIGQLGPAGGPRLQTVPRARSIPAGARGAVRAMRLYLRAGPAGGHTGASFVTLLSALFWDVPFKIPMGLEFLCLKVALVNLFPYLPRGGV